MKDGKKKKSSSLFTLLIIIAIIGGLGFIGMSDISPSKKQVTKILSHNSLK